MTVSYTLEVANASTATFFKLLFRWRGSIYRCLWTETLIYFTAYFVVSFIYRFGLNTEQRRGFELLALFCDRYSSYIPITFLLGFYVNLIVTRWWDVFINISWPDTVAMLLTVYYPGKDAYRTQVRRTIVRYMLASEVAILRNISTVVKKRFPTMEHIRDAGLLTTEELERYNAVPCQGYARNFIPFNWCFQLLSKIYHQAHKPITDVQYKHLIDEILAFKGGLGALKSYDWVSVPLVYTQVVTIAVYSFFLSCLIGRQYLDPAPENKDKEIDLYFPIFTFLQFIFYLGWLKVAENLINPLGEDDDDFELNWILDRNVMMGYILADHLCGDTPDLVDDIWKETHEAPSLPYTVASVGLKDHPQIGSTSDYEVSAEQSVSVPTTPVNSPAQSRLASRHMSRQVSKLDSISRRSSGNSASPAAFLLKRIRNRLGGGTVAPSPMPTPKIVTGGATKSFGSNHSIDSVRSSAANSMRFQQTKPVTATAPIAAGGGKGRSSNSVASSPRVSPAVDHHRTFFGRQYSSPEGELVHLESTMQLDDQLKPVDGESAKPVRSASWLRSLQGIAEDDETCNNDIP